MRILHCSDFHGHIPWFHWLREVARQYDLVCLTGDLIDLFSKASPDEQLTRISETLRGIETPLAICSGNHDLPDASTGMGWMRTLLPAQLYADGNVFTMKGYTFRCIGWQESFPMAVDATEVWLAHAPPDECATSQAREVLDYGSFDLGEVCRSGMGPRLILSGHIHNPLKWHARIERTWSFNPGVGTSRDHPNVIELNLERKIAIHTHQTTRGPIASNPLKLI